MILPKTNSRNFPESEKISLSDGQRKRDECILDVTDSKGRINLCCCYVIDDDGIYTNPCYLPADDCCRF